MKTEIICLKQSPNLLVLAASKNYFYVEKVTLSWKWDISLKDALLKVTVCNLMPSVYYVLNKKKHGVNFSHDFEHLIGFSCGFKHLVSFSCSYSFWWSYCPTFGLWEPLSFDSRVLLTWFLVAFDSIRSLWY